MGNPWVRGIGLVWLIGVGACVEEPGTSSMGDAGTGDGSAVPDADVMDGSADAETGTGPCDGVDCSHLDGDCVVGACDPDTGDCHQEPAPDGTACDDGTACTGPDVCTGGSCAGGPSCSPVCPTAPVIAQDAVLLGEDVGLGSTASPDECVYTSDGKTVYYALRVPESHRVVARVTPTDASWDAVARMIHSCGATSCLEQSDVRDEGGLEYVVFDNLDPVDVTVFLAVGSADAAVGTFDLDVRFQPIPEVTNDECGGAPRLEPGERLIDQDGRQGGATTATDGSCEAPLEDPLFYRVEVDAGEAVEVSVTPLDRWHPYVAVLGSCTAAQCVADGNGGAWPNPTRNLFHNTSGVPVDVVFAVGWQDTYSSHPPGGGFFDIEVRSASAPPDHRVCADATHIPSETVLEGEDLLRADGVSECGSSYTLDDALYYQVRVPGLTGVEITARGDRWNPTILRLDACGETALSCEDSGGTDGRLLTANRQDTEQDILIAVGNQDWGDYHLDLPVAHRGIFDLEVRHRTLPANAQCTMATPLPIGEVLTDQDSTLGLLCGDMGSPDTFYAVDVPPGQGVHVHGEELSNPDWPTPLQLQLYEECDGHCQLFSSRLDLSRYHNVGASPKRIYVRPSVRSDTPYSITAERLPYDKELISPSCDDTSDAPALLTAARQATDPAELPFAFEYFGEPLSHYWISSMVTAVALQPGSTDPGTVVPSFLYVSATGGTTLNAVGSPSTSAVRADVFGTSPNRHLTIHWENWEASGSPGSELDVQVKLFESTGAIEIHYCSLGDFTPSRAEVVFLDDDIIDYDPVSARYVPVP